MSNARSIGFVVAAALVASIGCKSGSKADKPDKTGNAGGTKITLSSAPALPDRAVAKVTALAITSSDRAIALQRAGSGWMLTATATEPADKVAVEMALRELERMELAPEPVASTKAQWPQFAVAASEVVTLEATLGGNTSFTVHLGKKQHVRIGDDPRVYPAYHINYFSFARELRFWRARALLPPSIGAVNAVTIEKGPHTARARRTGSQPTDPWRLDTGASAVGKLDPAAPGSTASRIRSLIAYDIVAANTVSAKLDKPRVVITLHTENGEHTVRVGATIGDVTYLAVSGDDRVFVVKNHAIEWLLPGPKAWAQP